VPKGTEDKVYSAVVSPVISVIWWWPMYGQNMYHQGMNVY
jgi:hypothetical protein